MTDPMRLHARCTQQAQRQTRRKNKCLTHGELSIYVVRIDNLQCVMDESNGRPSPRAFACGMNFNSHLANGTDNYR
jgi:hypothetical protein